VADESGTQGTAGVVDAAGPPSAPLPERKPGFLSTPRGKTVAIVAAILVVLVLVGIIGVFLFFFFGVNKAAQQAVRQAGTQVPARSAAAADDTRALATAEATGVTPPPPVTNATFFQFRNPFKPLIVAPEPTSSVGTTSSAVTTGSAATTGTGEIDVLTLQDIVVVDNVEKAVLTFNGETFTVGEGEVLGGTPWKVLSVGDGSVTMLYGDVQVMLSVGEGTQGSK
jgi:hypothetical protein